MSPEVEEQVAGRDESQHVELVDVNVEDHNVPPRQIDWRSMGRTPPVFSGGSEVRPSRKAASPNGGSTSGVTRRNPTKSGAVVQCVHLSVVRRTGIGNDRFAVVSGFSPRSVKAPLHTAGVAA
jgi:hypothetical protein